MLDESTDAMSVSEEPDSDILRLYEAKLLLEEQLAELRQQVAERDQEIDELKRQLDHTSTEYQQSLQTLEDAGSRVEIQVNDYTMYEYNYGFLSEMCFSSKKLMVAQLP